VKFASSVVGSPKRAYPNLVESQMGRAAAGRVGLQKGLQTADKSTDQKKLARLGEQLHFPNLNSIPFDF
jgi:hypothetical protein